MNNLCKTNHNMFGGTIRLTDFDTQTRRSHNYANRIMSDYRKYSNAIRSMKNRKIGGEFYNA